MKLRNKIINYFAFSCKSGSPQAVLSPVTMSAEVAKPLIEQQFKREKKPELAPGPILHVCYDYDSQIIYIPNAEQFSPETKKGLLDVAKYRITKDFGFFSSKPPIEGSPFSSLRIRSLNSFSHAREIVKKHYQGKIFNDIPVLEVNLEKMPSTLKKLPPEFREYQELVGAYIGPSFASSISFIDEIDLNGRKRDKPLLLLNQKTPFILINIAKTSKRDEPTANEKEWVVLSGYRDYLYDVDASKEEKYIGKNREDIRDFADLYAIKRHLYLGWPFEEVCYLFMGSAKNFGELLRATDRLMSAAESLAQEGYKNPASIPYYMTFKIDNKFPLDFAKLINEDGSMNTEIQYRNFIIVDFDPQTSYVIIRTPVYITQDLCEKVLKARSKPFICRYNPVVNKIDVKGDSKAYTDLQLNRRQQGKMLAVVKSRVDKEKQKDLGFRTGKLASGESATDPTIYNVRKISDYLYASDFIQKMCKRYDLEFKDFDVVIGPIEQTFGAGVQGGYMDKSIFLKNKWSIPKEMAPGVFVSPPIMFVNSVTNPSYAKQTETLIHEYRHYIYGIKNPDYQITYKSPKHGKDYEQWFKYLKDKNEQAAHKDEIKFELGLGKSYDEIIRNKVGGKITAENYPIALKFSELVKEAVAELEEENEKNEEPIG